MAFSWSAFLASGSRRLEAESHFGVMPSLPRYLCVDGDPEKDDFRSTGGSAARRHRPRAPGISPPLPDDADSGGQAAVGTGRGGCRPVTASAIGSRWRAVRARGQAAVEPGAPACPACEGVGVYPRNPGSRCWYRDGSGVDDLDDSPPASARTVDRAAHCRANAACGGSRRVVLHGMAHMWTIGKAGGGAPIAVDGVGYGRGLVKAKGGTGPRSPHLLAEPDRARRRPGGPVRITVRRSVLARQGPRRCLFSVANRQRRRGNRIARLVPGLAAFLAVAGVGDLARVADPPRDAGAHLRQEGPTKTHPPSDMSVGYGLRGPVSMSHAHQVHSTPGFRE